jgi:hypothetical protein
MNAGVFLCLRKGVSVDLQGPVQNLLQARIKSFRAIEN